MSTLPDNEIDLEKLFLPAWAQEPSSAKSYANFEGGEERFDHREGGRGPRPPRRDGGPRREGGPQFGERRGPGRPDQRGGGRPFGGGGPGGPGGGRPQRGHDDRGPRREPERREPPRPLPELNLSLIPDDRGVESLARQIKMTGRAFPLFDIAQMILQKPERHLVTFSIKKNAEGKPVQPLFICALDDTLWLSEEEAVDHVLRKHFATFYQADRTATEPPKGKYTFVGQCGISGVVLGPPNHHDYQNQLRKLHTDRFSRMPFEVYKSRVRIVRDEEVVKKWVEDQSWKTEYVCLNLPEATRLGTMEAVQQHFREIHKDNIIKPVESYKMTGAAARSLRSPELVRMVRSVWEDQRRFPLQIATVLSQQFASHGLQFFKVNKTLTHVSVARPHFLDLDATPVSKGVKNIVDYINAHAKCTRRVLLQALAPTPPAPPSPAIIPVPAPEAVPAAEAPATAEAPAAPAQIQPTPEQTAVISDLHWLIHQGHVIEFASGVLETAKKPLPKPPRPEPKPVVAVPKAAVPAEAAPTETPATPATEPVAEASPVTEAPAALAAEAPVAPAPEPTAVETPAVVAEPKAEEPPV